MKRAVAKLMTRLAKSQPDSPVAKIDSSSVEDFYILLDHPHKLWLPGEEISGQVVLVSRKNLANIAIVFSLRGYVKIHALPQSKLRPVKHMLFNHAIKIYGPETAPLPGREHEFVNGLYKGEHRFPFIVKLPNKRVFTSIDFGKGAIVYVLKTSLKSASEPSEHVLLPASTSSSSPADFFSIKSLAKLSAPSFSSEKIINLINPIDVADLPLPKPKRLLIKNPHKNLKLLRVQLSNSTLNTFSTFSSNDSDTAAVSSNPLTPNLINSHLALSSASVASKLPDSPKNIRVSLELARRGFLKGELIPIKLTINHLKKIQDSRGIIVTLVRVCRLDYGLDGFYESFRKDLQQLVIPLFVDPKTFSLEINTSLRVPPDAFPTISGCPIVSFQYFIEVMLNLSGKSLSFDGPSEHPKSAAIPLEEPQSSPGNTLGAYSIHPYQMNQDRSDFINTDRFKRLKKFLLITSEVVIGTFRLEKPETSATSPAGSVPPVSSLRRPLVSDCSTSSPSHYGQTPSSQQRSQGIPSIAESLQVDDFVVPSYLETTNTPSGSRDVFPEEPVTVPMYEDILSVPMPLTLEHLSEKERMRRHEASLLPSEPHFDDSENSEQETVSPLDHNSHIFDVAGESPLANTATNILSSSEANLYRPPNSFEPLGLAGLAVDEPEDFVPNYDNAANDRLVSTTALEGNTR